MGIDNGAGKEGNNVATIKSIDKSIDGFGTLMQVSSAKKFPGQRIHMSGFAKSNNVNGWGGFRLRVDQANSKKFLSFDNM